jgi:hypothetical protein
VKATGGAEPRLTSGGAAVTMLLPETKPHLIKITLRVVLWHTLPAP